MARLNSLPTLLPTETWSSKAVEGGWMSENESVQRVVARVAGAAGRYTVDQLHIHGATRSDAGRLRRIVKRQGRS